MVKRPPSHRFFVEVLSSLHQITSLQATNRVEVCTFTQSATTHAQCKIIHKLCHDNINTMFFHLEYEPEYSRFQSAVIVQAHMTDNSSLYAYFTQSAGHKGDILTASG